MAGPGAGIPFHKGHGTENDFVLLPDPDGQLDLTASRVRALCDRHRGLGADGVLRVVRTSAISASINSTDEPGAASHGAEWFMDYRNADGSLAEMCGNGVRVFARYLAEAGWVTGDELLVATRGGTKRVWFNPDGNIGVDMGVVRSGTTSWALLGGQRFTGVAVDVGNPHLACVTELPLEKLDLTEPPLFDETLFPNGVNVELLAPPADGAVCMRVVERGVGETRSCGTGTVAASVAALRYQGRDQGALTVRVPGGEVRVELDTAGTATLTGPAVLVAEGVLNPDWWRSLG